MRFLKKVFKLLKEDKNFELYPGSSDGRTRRKTWKIPLQSMEKSIISIHGHLVLRGNSLFVRWKNDGWMNEVVVK